MKYACYTIAGLAWIALWYGVGAALYTLIWGHR